MDYRGMPPENESAVDDIRRAVYRMTGTEDPS